MKNILSKKSISNNKQILSNTFYLSLIEAFRLILPFIALPYIIKTIGGEKYGTIVFIQSVVSYFTMLINFGLDLSAVRTVSISRNNTDELNKIVSTVFIIKGLLFIISLIVFSIIIFTVNIFRTEFIVCYFVFLSCISDILFPTWYFQGIEKMKIITLIRSISILFYFISIFIFVKSKADYIYVPFLQSLGLVFSSVIGFFLLLVVEKVKFVIPQRKYITDVFVDGIPFFLSRISAIVNTNIARTLSGIFLSMTDVAIFDLAQKITSASVIPLNMLNNAIFPRNSLKQNKVYNTKVFLFYLLCSFFLASFIFFASPILVQFFSGSELMGAVLITKILSLWIIFVGVSYYTGTSTLVAFGFSKYFNMSVLFSTLFTLLIFLTFYLTNSFTLITFAFALIFSEFFVAAYRTNFCFKFKLLTLRDI